MLIAMSKTVTASEFKARCLALLDEVAETHADLIVTKRGKPVARLVPVDRVPSLFGSVRILADEELLFSTGETWNADGGG